MEGEQQFRDWLKQRRKGLDLTQKELARRAGCSIYTVQRIEEGVLWPAASSSPRCWPPAWRSRRRSTRRSCAGPEPPARTQPRAGHH
jgi:DNA-binding XRE family transcriptional regulator